MTAPVLSLVDKAECSSARRHAEPPVRSIRF